MSMFALTLNNTVVQIDAATFPVAAPLVWTSDISAVSPEPQPGWSAVETAGAWTFAAPAAPPGPTLAQQAQTALNTMDSPGGCAIRCFKAGVPFPANWQAYTLALREIVNGTSTVTVLPVAPAFPAGT